MTLHAEILQQPDALDRLLTSGRPAARAVADRWAVARPTHVLIAARGTSDNAARYAQYLWGERAGLTVGLATPALFGRDATPPRLTGAAVVGISQSGASPDLVAVVEEAARQGRPTLAITNEADSPLAAAADQVLLLDAGPERAVAATKTHTAQLAAVALLASAMVPHPDDERALAAIPAAVTRALDTEPDVTTSASRWRTIDRCAVVGRGTGLATAHEWALKLQELAYVLAQPASTADFAHGPRAVVDDGFPVLGVAMAGPLLDGVLEALQGLRVRGARTLVLTDRPDRARVVADDVLVVPGDLPAWLAPIAAIVPAQLWCRAVTLARGADPDHPRGLEKVTLTR